MTRSQLIQQLGTYFASKGRVLSAEEYKQSEDVPVRFQIAKRTIGSWSRLENMIGDLSKYNKDAIIVPANPAAAVVEEPVAEAIVVEQEVAVEPEAEAPVKPATKKA